MKRHLLLLAVVTGLFLAGCGSNATNADSAQDTAGSTVNGGAAGDGATFVADDIVFTQAPSDVPAGQVTVELVNEGAIVHDVVIEEIGDEVVATANGGETATGQVELEPGTYTYYCSIAGHRSAGMEGTLTVQG